VLNRFSKIAIRECYILEKSSLLMTGIIFIGLSLDELFLRPIYYMFEKRLCLKLYGFSFLSILSTFVLGLSSLNGKSTETYDYMFAVCWIIYTRLTSCPIWVLSMAFIRKYALPCQGCQVQKNKKGQIWPNLAIGSFKKDKSSKM